MRRFLCLCIPLLLAGCAETQFLAQASKMWGSQSPEGGQYKVGKPYQVNGTWYTPKEDWEYIEVGTASWYGDEFHGRKTANGDRFDKNQLTAAHRTLPMPSLIRVTNLTNGRTAVLRVNDRGPFTRGRILDVSHAAARVLGFEGQGTAQVKVELLAEESRRLAQEMGVKLPDQLPRRDPLVDMQTSSLAQPVQAVETVELEAPPTTTQAHAVISEPVSVFSTPPDPSGKVISAAPPDEPMPMPRGNFGAPAESGSGVFIQVGSFSKIENVERLKDRLQNLGHVQVVTLEKNGKKLYRVRLGPLQNEQQARSLRDKIADLGIMDAKIITD